MSKIKDILNTINEVAVIKLKDGTTVRTIVDYDTEDGLPKDIQDTLSKLKNFIYRGGQRKINMSGDIYTRWDINFSISSTNNIDGLSIQDLKTLMKNDRFIMICPNAICFSNNKEELTTY